MQHLVISSVQQNQHKDGVVFSLEVCQRQVDARSPASLRADHLSDELSASHRNEVIHISERANKQQRIAESRIAGTYSRFYDSSEGDDFFLGSRGADRLRADLQLDVDLAFTRLGYYPAEVRRRRVHTETRNSRRCRSM